MLDFARRWYPYGGGPAEDILVEFGIPPTRYFRRLKDLLEWDPPEPVDSPVIAAILTVCRRRLWLEE